MSATEQDLSPLPTGDELAWVDYLSAETVGKAVETVEYLEEAFNYKTAGDSRTVVRPSREFETMTLERLGRHLLLSRELASSADTLKENAERLAQLAHSIYHSAEDTGKGSWRASRALSRTGRIGNGSQTGSPSRPGRKPQAFARSGRRVGRCQQLASNRHRRHGDADRGRCASVRLPRRADGVRRRAGHASR